MLWDNGLYPVTCILNKCWLASSQAGSRSGARRIRGRGKFQSAVITQTERKPDKEKVRCDSLKKVPSHVANTDKNDGLI